MIIVTGLEKMLNPLRRQKDERKSQTSETKTDLRVNDGVYAAIRRLKQDLAEITATVSVLKRDVARIDRKQYRDNGKDGPDFISEVKTQGGVSRSGYGTNWG